MAVNVHFITKHCFLQEFLLLKKAIQRFKATTSIWRYRCKMWSSSLRQCLKYWIQSGELSLVLHLHKKLWRSQVRMRSTNTWIMWIPIGRKRHQTMLGTDKITPESCYNLKEFIDDDMLNKICLDKTLFHIPKSHGSYVDCRTGRLTASGRRAKEKLFPAWGEVGDDDESPDQAARKIRKCPPKCVVCCAIADPKGKDMKISQTTIHCSLCLVALCITKKVIENHHVLRYSIR